MKKEEKLEIIELLKSEVTEDLGIKILSEKFNCATKYPFSWLKERFQSTPNQSIHIRKAEKIGSIICIQIVGSIKNKMKILECGIKIFKFYLKTHEDMIKLYRFFRDAGYKTFNGILTVALPIPNYKLNNDSPIHTIERISFPNSGFYYSSYLIQKE